MDKWRVKTDSNRITKAKKGLNLKLIPGIQ